MACPGGVGHLGSLRYSGKTIPFLSGSISKSREIVKSQPIAVGRDSSDRSIHNFSRGKTVVQGNFSTEIFSSGTLSSGVLALLKDAINPNCDTLSSSGGGSGLVFCPDGNTTITINNPSVIATASLKGNNGGKVSANFTFLASGLDLGAGGLTSAWQFESSGLNDDGNPLPYYSSSLTIGGAGGDTDLINDYLMEWEVNINNNPELIYTFCDDNTEGTANKIHLGLLEVSGMFQYWGRNTAFAENVNEGAITIDIGVGTISIPKAIFVNDDIPNTGPNAAVFRTINFEGVGSGDDASIKII